MKVIGILLLTAIYVVSPIDFVPDVIPILGWLDDLGVIGFACSALSKMGDEAA